MHQYIVHLCIPRKAMHHEVLCGHTQHRHNPFIQALLQYSVQVSYRGNTQVRIKGRIVVVVFAFGV